MGTTNTDFLPNTTGLNLGSPDQEWDGFFQDLVVTGSINGGLTSAESIQNLATSQAVGFALGVNTHIRATGGTLGITLTLPSPLNYAGRTMRFKKMDLTVGAVNLSGTIDGNSSYALTNQYQYVCVESSGSSWDIVGNN